MAYTLLTGASSGIGAAVARTLAQERNLILNGRDKERLEKTRRLCLEAGHDAILFPYDLAEPKNLGADLGTFIKENRLEIEAFVHCAGMTEVLSISRTKYHIGLKVMNVNYFSATEIISALLKKNINGKNLNSVIFITSIAAANGAPHQPHYCASKGALEALRVNLAKDLAPNVRVNAIAPGSFPTPMWETPLAPPDWRQSWNPPTLLPPGTVQDVANTVKFLLSPDAAYLTGVLLPVNGGELVYK